MIQNITNDTEDISKKQSENIKEKYRKVLASEKIFRPVKSLHII